jgi:hypothetical protein
MGGKKHPEKMKFNNNSVFQFEARDFKDLKAYIPYFYIVIFCD